MLFRLITMDHKAVFLYSEVLVRNVGILIEALTEGVHWPYSGKS